MIGTKLIIMISVVVTIAAFVIERHINNRRRMPEFQRMGSLFSAVEQAFLDVLEQALGEQGRVFGMVRVTDVLNPVRDLGSKEWRFAFNKIQNTRFDFVICDPKTMAVICAIELHDNSNPNKDWNERDKILTTICASAGLPLIRLPWQPDYSVSEIRALVLTHLSEVEAAESGQSDEAIAILPADYYAQKLSADQLPGRFQGHNT